MQSPFLTGSPALGAADHSEWLPYFEAQTLLERNLHKFKCKIPPIVLELTFYNLWSWDVPAMLETLLPDLKRAVLRKRSNAWNCVWLSKMAMPNCDRTFCELIFFGNQDMVPESPKFREIMLDLMHHHEELTGYNIVGMPYECAIDKWLSSFCRIANHFSLLECGQMRQI